MKLVDILARQLKVWPEEWGIFCVSSAVEGSFAAWFGYRNPVFEDGGWSDIGTVEIWLSEEPEDRKCVVVRRFEWQAAVDALKADEVVGWNGEALPPAGTSALIHEGPASWVDQKEWIGLKVKVICTFKNRIGQDIAVVEDAGGTCGCFIIECLKPIRTPEQIAAEEREQDAQALFELINPEGKWHKFAEEGKARFRAAVAAGYRKTTPTDN